MIRLEAHFLSRYFFYSIFSSQYMTYWMWLFWWNCRKYELANKTEHTRMREKERESAKKGEKESEYVYLCVALTTIMKLATIDSSSSGYQMLVYALLGTFNTILATFWWLEVLRIDYHFLYITIILFNQLIYHLKWHDKATVWKHVSLTFALSQIYQSVRFTFSLSLSYLTLFLYCHQNVI